MPPSDHVDHARRHRSDGGVTGGGGVSGGSVGGGGGGGGGGAAGRGEKATRPRRRVGVALDISDTPNSLLSPLVSHFSLPGLPNLPNLPNLQGLAGLPSLKGFLPTSPTKQPSTFVDGTGTGAGMGAGTSTMAGMGMGLEEEGKAVWQEGDLEDGRGMVPLLLLTSKSAALQIFALPPSTIPDDPHVPENFRPPEEVWAIGRVKYEDGVDGGAGGQGERVLGMRLLDEPRPPLRRGRRGVADEDADEEDEHPGPLVALTTLTPSKKSQGQGLGALALVVLSLRTGLAVRRVELGVGSAADVVSSGRAVVVSVSHPTPTIHILHPTTFHPLHPPITSLPSNPLTSLPVLSLSGRLLAYVTTTPPHAPNPDGLGSLITSSTLQASARSSSASRGAQPHAGPQAGQQRQSNGVGGGETAAQMALSSAVEIGGGVARGVWAGLKLGARAAGAARAARNERLARSAPEEKSGVLGDESEGEGGESRSLDEESVLDGPAGAGVAPGAGTGAGPEGAGKAQGGEWIKVIDLFPRAVRAPRSPVRSHSTTSRRDPSLASSVSASTSLDTTSAGGVEVIAHFRLPNSSALHLSGETPASPRGRGARAPPRSSPAVSTLRFSPSGTQLFAAPVDGRSFHIVELHPAGALKAGVKGEVKGQAWHLYELKRGHTGASVSDVKWDREGRWIGVGTGKGTVHVFPVNPSGGPSSASTHANNRHTNPSQLYPLSTTSLPIVRLRPGRLAPLSPDTPTPDQSPGRPHSHASNASGAVLAFLQFRRHPTARKTFVQDMAIYRPVPGVLELARVTLQRQGDRTSGSGLGVRVDGSAAGAGTGANGGGSPGGGGASGALQRRGSALTEMMRAKAFGEQSDLLAESAVRARWALPSGADEDVLLPSSHSLTKPPRSSKPAGPAHMGSLARAEIRTHHPSARILPSSIYLSRQVDFFAAQAIDEYTPLSMMDLEARMRRLVFRHEVEARSPPSERTGSSQGTEKAQLEARSFDEPLLSALHSIIESPPSPQIPGLPNGYPGGRGWGAIPIRSVKAGLGEGVDRFRREYARAQYVRARRASEVERAKRAGGGAVERLSFEDDAVFATPDDYPLSTNGDAPTHISSSHSHSHSRSNSNSLSASSPPSSGLLPATTVDSSEGDPDADADGWGEKWEEEYRKAVEDDGGPDDLVLGLMDEEEEERRRWAVKQGGKQGYGK
ncbi:hypothetical protein IAT38_008257 [Cryptococcus sp. DSM 104549]